MYGYYLGGDNNFEADRIACMELDKLVPGTRGLAINNRNYLVRVVRALAHHYGIRQFIDIGPRAWPRSPPGGPTTQPPRSRPSTGSSTAASPASNADPAPAGYWRACQN